MSDELASPPGETMKSGFRYRPVAPNGGLSDAARRRVIKKMDSVDEARRRAAKVPNAIIG